VTGYVGKYMSKMKLQDGKKIGRWWGVKGAEYIPFAQCLEAVISLPDAHQLIRYMMKKGKMKHRCYPSLYLSCDANQWISKLDFLEGVEFVVVPG
jgi:hypothetical protein